MEVTSEPDQASPAIENNSPCPQCNNLVGKLDKEVEKEAFLASTKTCPWCSVILKALQSVTDVTRPEFTRFKFYREKTIVTGQNVLNVRCYQKDLPIPNSLHTTHKDPFNNSYNIYTPPGMRLILTYPRE